ncbi:hypothetical protein p2A211 (plasmid) [Aromatoleum aromaticum EbN1]|uniref:Uncharacterized protein n=1 Tax=Aromatoleum aromaticum (strain DSM 19018 / LMG 30748 / EbN1) TaxID=76114 RepID=Q5NWD4_AROAE|nr:hypothetical protein p2A211 [Aromatoleum aromaticum EbN1]
MPLQQRQLLRRDRFFHPQGTEDLVLVCVDGRHPRHRFGGAEPDAVVLDAMQLLERPLGGEAGVRGAQPRAHDAVQDQRHEADRGVCADAFGQPVIDRPNLDLGFEHLEAALDVGERLVARDDVGSRSSTVNLVTI